MHVHACASLAALFRLSRENAVLACPSSGAPLAASPALSHLLPPAAQPNRAGVLSLVTCPPRSDPRSCRSVVAAWAGDSRAVLGMAPEEATGALTAVPLTQDHKPLGAEAARIQQAGGQVLRAVSNNTPVGACASFPALLTAPSGRPFLPLFRSRLGSLFATSARRAQRLQLGGSAPVSECLCRGLPPSFFSRAAPHASSPALPRPPAGPHRVCLPARMLTPGLMTPGLTMSRAFGVLELAPAGVIPTPDLAVFPRPASPSVLVVATDGLWEVRPCPAAPPLPAFCCSFASGASGRASRRASPQARGT